MTSRIVVNNIQADTGTPTVNVGSGLSVTGSVVVTGTVNSTGVSTFTSGIVVSAGTTSAPSISPTGDSNTGIFFPSPDTIAFGEGGVEAARFDSSGRLGIGSAIPTQKLEVRGNVFVRGETISDKAKITFGFTNGVIQSGKTEGNVGADYLAISGNGGVRDDLVVTVDGNIGIGTAVPSQKLEVVGGEIKAGRVDASQEGGQFSLARSTDNATAWYMDVYGNTSTPSLRFVDVSNGVVRAQIDGSGRMTRPYQPAFYAWLNTVSTTVTVGNSFPFNATVFNVGSHLDTSTNPGRFTAPVAGYYLFGCTVADDDAAEFVGKIVTFYKNGGVYRDIIEGIPTPNAHFEFHQTTLMQLNAGDYADIRMRSGSVTLNGGNDGPAYRNAFYGYLL